MGLVNIMSVPTHFVLHHQLKNREFALLWRSFTATTTTATTTTTGTTTMEASATPTSSLGPAHFLSGTDEDDETSGMIPGAAAWAAGVGGSTPGAAMTAALLASESAGGSSPWSDSAQASPTRWPKVAKSKGFGTFRMFRKLDHVFGTSHYEISKRTVVEIFKQSSLY